MSVAPSFSAVFMLLFAGGGLGPMLGLPPGDRDPALLRCPPANTIVYSEWAERGPGAQNAGGIKGLIADHEVQEFLDKVEAALVKGMAGEVRNAPPEVQAAADAAPRLIRVVLNHPGCLYLSYQEDNVLTGDTAPAIGMSFLQGLRFAVIINAGKQADKTAEDLKTLTAFLPEEVRKESLDRQQLPLPLPGVPVLVHRHKDYFLLTVGQGVLDQAIAALDGKSNGLAENERFLAATKHVTFEKTGSLSWVDIAKIRKIAIEAAEPTGFDLAEWTAKLGIDSLDSHISATGLANGQISIRQFLTTDGSTNGILKLAAGRAITQEDFDHVPADADFLFTISVNGQKIIDEVRRVLTAIDERQVQEFDNALQGFHEATGLSLENDLLKPFGDVWTAYNSPSGGGILFSGLVVSLEVRDLQEARKTVKKVMMLLQQQLPGVNQGEYRARGVELKMQSLMGRTIFYLNTVGDDDFPLAPAFCLTKERLYVALHPQNIKAHLRFSRGKFDRFSSKLKGELELSDGDLLCMTYWDAPSTAKLLYAIVPYVGQLAMSQVQSHTEAEIDIFDLPSARGLLPYIGPHASAVYRQKDGIYTRTTCGLPIPFGQSLGLVVPFLAGATSVRTVETFEAIAEPVPADAPAAPPR